MKTTGRRLLLGAFLAALLGASLYAFLPRPIAVETAPAAVGPLSATIDEEGRTRARDRYTIAAPTAGDLERLTLRAGDQIKRGQVLAVLHLSQLDPRERDAARGKLRAAEALRREAAENAGRAAADTTRAAADAEQAARERERAEQLHAKGYIPLQELEQARSAETAARSAETAAVKGAEAARFHVEAARSEVAVAQAALLAGEAGVDDERRRLTLRAPVDGRVLRVLEESERVVAAGTPILEVGDPTRLEVVIEVLSSDAVRVRPGMPVRLEGWGGERPLMAAVRTIEPAAFTKVSALGVEEQRVNVVADIVGAPVDLGDGYRVEARIVTWAGDAVLKVPASALFRDAATAAGGAPSASGPGWAVFTVGDRRARLRRVEVGHRTAAEAEITAGLAAGDRVVLHPPNELRDGVRVTVR